MGLSVRAGERDDSWVKGQKFITKWAKSSLNYIQLLIEAGHRTWTKGQTDLCFFYSSIAAACTCTTKVPEDKRTRGQEDTRLGPKESTMYIHRYITCWAISIYFNAAVLYVSIKKAWQVGGGGCKPLTPKWESTSVKWMNHYPKTPLTWQWLIIHACIPLYVHEMYVPFKIYYQYAWHWHVIEIHSEQWTQLNQITPWFTCAVRSRQSMHNSVVCLDQGDLSHLAKERRGAK